MTDLFDYLYSSIQDRNAFLTKIRWYSVLRGAVRLAANTVLPVEYLLTQSNRKYRLGESDKTKDRIIVSLTTFPARIGKVWLVIETLLRQTKKPDRIVLWLSKEQFASLDRLPKRLLRMQQRGLCIELREGDIRSHKKYYYALKEYPEDCLVTVDDDILYNSRILDITWRRHMQYPQAVIANYTHNMLFEGGEALPYSQWERNVKEGQNLFFGSGGCTLFPPHCMSPEVTDADVALRLCPTADDVWLNAMTRKQKTAIVSTDYHTEYLPIMNGKTPHLADENLPCQNDIQLHNVRTYFDE